MKIWIIALILIITHVYCKKPTWRTVNIFSGTIPKVPLVKYDNFTSLYGTANDARVIIDVDKGANKISHLNVTYCLQRKIFNPGQDFNSCRHKLILQDVKFPGTQDESNHISNESHLTFPVTKNLGHLESSQMYFSYFTTSTAVTNIKFNVTLEVLSCDQSEAIDADFNCVKYIQLEENTPVDGTTTTMNESITFVFKTSHKDDHIIGGNTIEIELDKTTNVIYYGKFGASPTPSNYDFILNGTGNSFTAPIDISLSGNWFNVLIFNDPVSFNLKSKTSYCPVSENKTSIGINCTQDLPNIGNNGTLYIDKATSDDLTIYRVKATSSIINPMNISLAPYNESIENKFELYVSADELPFFSDMSNLTVSDLYRCSLNESLCSIVHTIILNIPEAKYYYIGVRFNGEKESPYFGLFKNSQCPDCKYSSTCSKDPETRGVCICNNGYNGVDCNGTKNIIKLRLAVFIIVGSILGFTLTASIIAFIISSRKRVISEGGFYTHQ